jgi:hypothetical protein
MKTLRTLLSLSVFFAQVAFAQGSDQVNGFTSMDPCTSLPSSIRVVRRSKECGALPTVVLRGSWRGAFSAAFRWDDGTADGQDRNPNSLGNGSAASSPYKTKRRFRRGTQDVLCYGNFLNGAFPVPEQLTIKRSVAPRLDRFCVDFSNQ